MLSTSNNANKAICKITYAKLYVAVVTLSTEDNAKLTNNQMKDLKDLFIGTSMR